MTGTHPDLADRNVNAEDLASLRRVAMMVAAGAASADVFQAVAEEVGRVTGLPLVALWRYEPGDMVTVLGAWGERPHPFQAGTRWPLDGPTICARVRATGRTARIDDFAVIPGTVGDAARETGIHACAGAPIIVDGDVWGAMSADTTDGDPLPAHIEDRLTEFTELVAAAISSAAGRDELARLAEEQAALRRVATLVAQSVPRSALFAAVTAEVGTLLGADFAGMVRYEPNDTVTPVAVWSAVGEHPAVPDSWPLEEGDAATLIARTRAPTRIGAGDRIPGQIAAFARELGIRSSVGGPILVDGRVWGALAVHSIREEPLPADTESRLLSFTELVSTAMSNAHARADVERLADEQAALRRVATLVANDSPPGEVLAAVAEEIGRLLSVDVTATCRYEADGTATVVAAWGARVFPVGERVTVHPKTAAGQVLRTGRPVRIDSYAEVNNDVGSRARAIGIRSAVGTPIFVDGQLWGMMLAASQRAEPLPVGTESRVGEFTELVASAISNVQAREDLAASRARLVTAADEERRRVVRDLHDGAQQRLVHTIIVLKQASHALRSSQGRVPRLVDEALEQAQRANVELRELAHGILPAVLTRGGLRGGVEALAARMPIPVAVDVSASQLPERVEATAYFVIAEALTNVAKHAQATGATVQAHVDAGTLRLEVRDDGIGGAQPEGGGLLGLADRVAVADDELRVESPADGGTVVAADIPLSV